MDRLETIVAAVVARAEEAAQRLDALTRRLDEDAPGPADPLRVAAIELAVAGYDRAQAESRLRQRFPGADLAPVLADVY